MHVIVYNKEGNVLMDIVGYKYIVNHALKTILIDGNTEFTFASVEYKCGSMGSFLKVVEA